MQMRFRAGMRGGRGPRTLSGGGLYWQRVKALFGSAVVAYWPLDELSGSAAGDVSGSGYHGTYTGVDLANEAGLKGGMAPYWDGANDVMSQASAGLMAAAPVDIGSVLIWAKAPAGVWTDGQRRWAVRLFANSTNYLAISRPTTNNQLQFYRIGNGSGTVVNHTVGSPTTWMHLGMTWSTAANEFKAYYNGAQAGTTQTGVAAFAAAATYLAVGAAAAAPSQVWQGHLMHCLLLNRVATATEIGQVYSWT